MSKSENTLLVLESALERIKQGNPKRIPTHRKLSVRAVEEEANLGNGSGYYYPDFVEKVKQTKLEIATGKGEIVQPEIQTVRYKLKEQKRIKDNYKAKYEAEREKLALFAAAQHHLSDKLVQALARIDELEYENAGLREELTRLKRSKVVSIK
jgi:replication-associated recombination protein RarA